MGAEIELMTGRTLRVQESADKINADVGRSGGAGGYFVEVTGSGGPVHVNPAHIVTITESESASPS